MTEIGELLDVALARFEDGAAWCKGVSRVPRPDDVRGNAVPDKVCLIAGIADAIDAASGPGKVVLQFVEVRDTIRPVLRELFPERFPPGAVNLAVFNDDSRTRWNDVRSVLVEARSRV